tara:strand:- start:2149 stop:2298 length:150 start_codon:yes stop_codon:yes gene_type:complete
MGYINHHHKKAYKDSVESENVGKTFDALLKTIIMCAEVPSPDYTHNNGE